MKITHRILQRIALNLPLRIIDHDGRPYLRRYHVGTLFGVRIYLHHFVDSDPVGIHNHPFKHSLSILLSGTYQEERRWCRIPNQRNINFVNYISADTLHRVLLRRDGADNPCTVWSLFFHTRKVMTWGTLKDKGAFMQYVEEFPDNPVEGGHSMWWKTARKGWQILDSKGNIRDLSCYE